MEPGAPSSEKATFFSFSKARPRSLLTAMIAGLALFGFVLHFILTRPLDPLYTSYALVGAAFILWIFITRIRQLSTLHNRVAVDDLGIWYLTANGAHTFVAWSDIATVKQHSVMTKYLEITDRSGAVKIKLENQLENFDTLKRLIDEHTSV